MQVTFLISISPLVPPPVDLLLSSAMKISFLEIGGAGSCGTYQCFGGLFQAYEALKICLVEMYCGVNVYFYDFAASWSICLPQKIGERPCEKYYNNGSASRLRPRKLTTTLARK
jgi:hypothetical protein